MRRRMMLEQARLPSEYQEVEWISGNNLGRIPTSYYPNQNSGIKYIYEQVSVDGRSYFHLEGNTTKVYPFGEHHNISYNNPYHTFGNKHHYFTTEEAPTQFEVERSGRYITVNGESYTFPEQTFQQEYPLMFGHGTKYVGDIMVTENDEVAGLFVMCYRKSDNVIGMYDLINNEFCEPTRGTFTKGADVL